MRALAVLAVAAVVGYGGYREFRAHTTPGGFCSSHRCIGAFNVEPGSVVECRDGAWSHAGGIPGACSHHSGVERDLAASDLVRPDGSTMPTL